MVRRALEEDLGRAGDITSDLTIPADAEGHGEAGGAQARHHRRADRRRDRFPAGRSVARHSTLPAPDGSKVEAGALLATISGPARAILTAERVALNFAGPSFRRRHRDRGAGGGGGRHQGAHRLHPQDHCPACACLQKYAVRCGGGFNHRFGLDDAVLIKDNHIAAAGGIAPALERVRAGLGHMVKIEIEVDTLAQLEEALALGADTILLDNMSLDDLRRAVAMAKGRAVLEASGNVTLATVRAIAETGVDYISSGAITHSALESGYRIWISERGRCVS